MAEWGKEAMKNAIDNNITNGRLVDGVSDNGLKFRDFLSDDGEIINFSPLIDN